MCVGLNPSTCPSFVSLFSLFLLSMSWSAVKLFRVFTMALILSFLITSSEVSKELHIILRIIQLFFLIFILVFILNWFLLIPISKIFKHLVNEIMGGCTLLGSYCKKVENIKCLIMLWN